jgi:hypothetical protein
MIDWLPNGLIAHNLVAPAGLVECRTVFDIGSGIRPMSWYTPADFHWCVEPHEAYRQRLLAAGYLLLDFTALGFLRRDVVCHVPFAIYLLDVIEHMTREDALECVRLAVGSGARQVVIFTPLGFLEQHGDAWGLGGDVWQEHRSGWTPEDFPGWRTELFGRGFFASFDGQ